MNDEVPNETLLAVWKQTSAMRGKMKSTRKGAICEKSGCWSGFVHQTRNSSLVFMEVTRFHAVNDMNSGSRASVIAANSLNMLQATIPMSAMYHPNISTYNGYLAQW